MPILITVSILILSLVAAVYSVNKLLKKNGIDGLRWFYVAKWLAILYLPMLFWLIISIILFRPLLSEGLQIMITLIIGVIWAIGVFASLRKKYPL